MDVVLKLRELRRTHGLSQKDVARRSGIGEKTISSFETGARIGALKLAQLERLIAVYGLDLASFFNPALDAELSGAPPPAVEHLRRIVEPLTPAAQDTLVATIATLAASLPHLASRSTYRVPLATSTRPHDERRSHGAHPSAPRVAAR